MPAGFGDLPPELVLAAVVAVLVGGLRLRLALRQVLPLLPHVWRGSSSRRGCSTGRRPRSGPTRSGRCPRTPARCSRPMPLPDSPRRDGSATKWSRATILCPFAVVPPTRPSRVANTLYVRPAAPHRAGRRARARRRRHRQRLERRRRHPVRCAQHRPDLDVLHGHRQHARRVRPDLRPLGPLPVGPGGHARRRPARRRPARCSRPAAANVFAGRRQRVRVHRDARAQRRLDAGRPVGVRPQPDRPSVDDVRAVRARLRRGRPATPAWRTRAPRRAPNPRAQH